MSIFFSVPLAAGLFFTEIGYCAFGICKICIDVLYIQIYKGDMNIEYDENKRQLNLKDHHIDFAKMSVIFENPIVSRVDDRIDYGEVRRIALGDLDGKIVVFVYTRLTDDTVRLISARRATKKESTIYYRRVYG